MEEENKEVDENLVIIDADSIVYVVGYQLADMLLEPLGIIEIDKFISEILIATESKHYLGFFGGTKGKNFRKDVAITKPYKGQRPESPDWYKFWSPIFKQRMEKHWGFQPCHNIEADDACSIAAQKYRDKYNKVTVASPDKDLYQIPDTWFFDYVKRTTLYCEQSVSTNKFCAQLVKGDTGDNIPGLVGAGESIANDIVAEISEEGLNFEDAVEKVKQFYVKWHTVILKAKLAKKQEKEFLARYKVDNGISRMSAKVKSTALKDFEVSTSSLLQKEDALILFKEQHRLLKLLDTEKEGLKYDFKIADIQVDTSVDWDSVIMFTSKMEEMTDEQDFDFEDDL